MPVEAIPLALVASLYPFGLAALVLLFGANRPRPRSVVFLTGAAACLLVVGLLCVFVLREAALDDSSNNSARYGFRVALGIVFLVGALVLARRPVKPKKPDDQPSRVSRAVSGSGLPAVFLLGVALYTPSPTYLAALNSVGSTEMSASATAAWVVLVVVLVLITIEVPILLYFVAPEWTVPKLHVLNQRLDRNGRAVLVWVLLVLGVWEIAAGLAGLL
jgi:hypothetical protein